MKMAVHRLNFTPSAACIGRPARDVLFLLFFHFFVFRFQRGENSAVTFTRGLLFVFMLLIVHRLLFALFGHGPLLIALVPTPAACSPPPTPGPHDARSARARPPTAELT